MIRLSPDSLSATGFRFALSSQPRLGRPSRLPTLTPTRLSLWQRLLALLEPAPTRQRRERRALVLPLQRRLG